MGSPDPVSEPKAYQDHLLALVGGEDPAAVQAGTPDAFATLLSEAGARLRTRPEPAEWSVLECFGHVVDAEMVYSARYRWILAHDEPPLIGYDQDRWVDTLDHGRGDPDQLLGIFRVLRDANLGLWARTGEADRARVGMHDERGPESYGLSFALIAGHDLFHLDQARRALAPAPDA